MQRQSQRLGEFLEVPMIWDEARVATATAMRIWPSHWLVRDPCSAIQHETILSMLCKKPCHITGT